MHGSDPVKLGDYALVIFGNSIYPALVGDVGPNDKVGEASLRIAKEINTLSTPYNRPVSDLKVTYLIFPDTADKPFGPPDLEKLQARCETLVKEIGGASVRCIAGKISSRLRLRPVRYRVLWRRRVRTASPSSSVSATVSASASPTFAFPIPSPVATTRLIRRLRRRIHPPQREARSRNASRERRIRAALSNLLAVRNRYLLRMIIRDAVEADLPAIVEIYNATVPTRMVTAELEPTTVEARLPWFREHSPEQYPFWVAELDGRVIGWLDFKNSYRVARIAAQPRSAFMSMKNSGVAVWGSDCWNTRLPAHRRWVSRPWSVSSSDITSRA
mgnify:CR=1 FL=1